MGNKKQYLVSFDLGGTKVLATLFDRRFKLLAQIKAKSRPQKGERYFFKTLHECFDHLLKEADVKRSEVVGIGVGCPGLIDEQRGVVTMSPNITFLNHFPIAKRIQKECGVPAIVGNDVNVGLYGEQQFGAAIGYDHVIGIFIGTGIGGAMILDGKLYAGATGGAGEIGHMQVDPFGPACGCGKTGCFESLCSRLSIATEAAALVARQKAPELSKIAGTDVLEIKSGELAQAIKRGDKALSELIKRKSRQIGIVMANLVNVLNPQLIVLGGGLLEAMPQLIVNESARAMREAAMAGLGRNVKVVAARLGDYAIVLGGAKRAWDRFGNHE